MRLIALALIASVVAAASARAASGSSWYWSTSRAEFKIEQSTGIRAEFRADYIVNVDCVPLGAWIWSSSGSPREQLYRRFDCSFNVLNLASERTVERILIVMGAQTFQMQTP